MTMAHHPVLRRERRRLRFAAAMLPVAAAACALAWAYMHRQTPGSWMRMPMEGVVSGTGRVSFPGIPDGSPGARPAQVPARADAAQPVTGLAPSTAPVVAGDGTFVPFPAQVGVDLATLGPRFGVNMPDPQYRWWMVGNAPPGFSEPAYDAQTASWSFQGVPEREGVYRLSLAWARNAERPTVLTANLVVAPATGGIPVAALAQADGRSFIGQPLGDQAALHGYLLPLGAGCATWTLEAGGLPPGLSLMPGCLPPGTSVVDPASVPTAAGRSTFTLAATAPDGTVAASDEIALSVAEPFLSVVVERHGPSTADGRPVSYRAVANFGTEEFPEPGYATGATEGDLMSYDLDGDLPTGLSFSPSTGTVSGVVRRGATGAFRIRATMLRTDGSRVTVYGDTVDYGTRVQAAD